MATTKQSCKKVPEQFYNCIENDVLRNYLIQNNYGTLVDLEDEQNRNLTVNINVINNSNVDNDEDEYVDLGFGSEDSGEEQRTEKSQLA